MEPTTVSTRPLCVDLDGTLVEADTMQDLIASFLRKRFWRAGALLVWLASGRAHFKKRLAEEAELPLERLPAHPAFVQFLREEHAAGRTLVLVSAADERTVRKVAEYFKFFSSAIGSDGKTNLRGEAKLKCLTDLYGAKGFDYAGNSSVDIPVWGGAAEAIVVDADPWVERRAREVASVSRVFPRHRSRWELFKRLL
jgi:phosphoserine phosphatase